MAHRYSICAMDASPSASRTSSTTTADDSSFMCDLAFDATLASHAIPRMPMTMPRQAHILASIPAIGIFLARSQLPPFDMDFAQKAFS